MGSPSLLERIQRRKLFHWAAVYVGFVIIVVQVLDGVTEAWAISEPTQQVIHLGLVLGFFLLLVLGWFHGEQGHQTLSVPEGLLLAVLLMAGALVLKEAGSGAWTPDPMFQEVAADPFVPDPAPPLADIQLFIPPFPCESCSERVSAVALDLPDSIASQLDITADLGVTTGESPPAGIRALLNNSSGRPEGAGMVLELTGSLESAGGPVVDLALATHPGNPKPWRDGFLWADTLSGGAGEPGEIAARLAHEVAREIRLAIHAELTYRAEEAAAPGPMAFVQLLEIDGRWNAAKSEWELDRNFQASERYVEADSLARELQEAFPRWSAPSLRRSEWALWLSEEERGVLDLRQGDWLQLALSNADHATLVDPANSRAHQLAGEALTGHFKLQTTLIRKRAFLSQALSRLEEALELDPSNVRALLASSELNRDRGRFSEAFTQALGAREADRFRVFEHEVYERICHTALESRNLGSAHRWCDQARDEFPGSLELMLLQLGLDAMASVPLPRPDQVRARRDTLVQLAVAAYPDSPGTQRIYGIYGDLSIAKALARSGHPQQADSLLAALEPLPTGLEYSAAQVDLLRNRRQEAMDRLALFFPRRPKLPEYWRNDWYLESLWGDPQFEALIEAPWIQNPPEGPPPS